MATAAARRYARAIFELAQQEDSLGAWTRSLETLRELMTDERVQAVLTNPTIDLARRMDLLSEPSLLDPQAVNLAKLLVESGRVGDIQGIETEFERLSDEAAGRVPATVTTAVELTGADRDRLAGELSKRLGKEVRLHMVVDPRIVGGLKLQYGDRLVDASVATRLNQLRRRLAAS